MGCFDKINVLLTTHRIMYPAYNVVSYEVQVIAWGTWNNYCTILKIKIFTILCFFYVKYALILILKINKIIKQDKVYFIFIAKSR